MLDAFQQPMASKFTSRFVNTDEIHKNKSVNYWKANFTQTDDEIIELIDRPFLESKSTATLEQMSEGLTYAEQGVGKICFFMNTTREPDLVSIEDALNNDVRDGFDLAYIPTLNGVVVISKNMYTSEPINIKLRVNEYN